MEIYVDVEDVVELVVEFDGIEFISVTSSAKLSGKMQLQKYQIGSWSYWSTNPHHTAAQKEDVKGKEEADAEEADAHVSLDEASGATSSDEKEDTFSDTPKYQKSKRRLSLKLNQK